MNQNEKTEPTENPVVDHAVVHSPNLRVVEHLIESNIGEPDSIYYTIQIQQRRLIRFWKFRWVNLQYEGGLPGYYHDKTYESMGVAIEEMLRFARGIPARTKTTRVVA